MANRQETRLSRASGVVRLSIPASVAFDLPSFQKSLALVAERLGHPQCFSGADCTFSMERVFVLDEALEIRPSPALPQDPVPYHSVTAVVPEKVSYNIAQIQEAAARIAGRLGCAPCCSGFDITFRRELDFLVDEKLNIRPATGAI